MSKFSLFTLFISATIVVITAELLTNEYAGYPQIRGNATASVMTENQKTAQEAVSPAAAESSSAEKANVNEAPQAKITFELINRAGFTGVSLQVVPFNGILFESVDLRDFKSVPVIFNNLLLNNRQKIASFYEFRAGNLPLSDEIFRMLKEKCGMLIGASVNATNAFGDASFYVNFAERASDAFLIVKAGDSVYALTYQKDYHELIRKLLWELTNN